jgi:hypothetical protein
MAKLFIVLAQEQKTVSHFRHLKKFQEFSEKEFAKIHITKQATRNSKMKNQVSCSSVS